MESFISCSQIYVFDPLCFEVWVYFFIFFKTQQPLSSKISKIFS